MSGRPIYLRVSLIERRWLRRTAIAASLPLIILAGWLQYIAWTPILMATIVVASIYKAAEMAARQCRAAARVWGYPDGPCQDIANPLCTGGIRELDRKGRVCPKCGATDDDVCLGTPAPARAS